MTRCPKLKYCAIGAIAVAAPIWFANVTSADPVSRQSVAEAPSDKADANEAEKASTADEKTESAADKKSEPSKADTDKASAGKADDQPPANQKAGTPGTDGKPGKAGREKPAFSGKAAAEKPIQPPAADEIQSENLVFRLQRQLKRVGCYHGAIDGIWGRRSYAALDAFGHFGNIHRDDLRPSEVWIRLVRAKRGVVCPSYYGYRRAYRQGGYWRGRGYYRAPRYGYRPAHRYRPRGYFRY